MSIRITALLEGQLDDLNRPDLAADHPRILSSRLKVDSLPLCIWPRRTTKRLERHGALPKFHVGLHERGSLLK